MLLEYVLFVILGWVAFVPATAAKNVLLVVFVVLMVLWILAGATGYIGHLDFPRRP